MFYAEILAWIGADIILLSAYFFHVHAWIRASKTATATDKLP